MSMFFATAEELSCAVRHPWVRLGALAAAMALVSLMFVAAYQWWPVHGDYDAIRDMLAQKRAEITRARNTALAVQSYDKVAPQVETLRNKLAFDGGQAKLLEHLEALAEKNGVIVITEAYEEGKVRDGFAPLHLRLTLQGDYAALREFIAMLHGLPSWTVLQEAMLARAGRETGEIKAMLHLVTYRTAASGRKEEQT